MLRVRIPPSALLRVLTSAQRSLSWSIRIKYDRRSTAIMDYREEPVRGRRLSGFDSPGSLHADVAQQEERHLAMVEATGSRPLSALKAL